MYPYLYIYIYITYIHIYTNKCVHTYTHHINTHRVTGMMRILFLVSAVSIHLHNIYIT